MNRSQLAKPKKISTPTSLSANNLNSHHQMETNTNILYQRAQEPASNYHHHRRRGGDGGQKENEKLNFGKDAKSLTTYSKRTDKEKEEIGSGDNVKKKTHFTEKYLSRKIMSFNWNTLEKNHSNNNVNIPEKSDLFEMICFRIKNNICPDITIHIGCQIVQCHSIVLLSYIKTNEQENQHFKFQNKIILNEKDINYETFIGVYKWMLSAPEKSHTKLSRENILDFLTASKYLQVEQLEDQCWAFIDNKHIFNEVTAFFLYLKSKNYNRSIVCEPITQLMLPRIQASFLIIVSSKNWIELDVNDVCAFLSSNYIRVRYELEIFMSGVRWLFADWENRHKHTLQICSCIRFGLMSPFHLVEIRQSNEFVSIITTSGVLDLITEGLTVATVKSSNTNIDNSQQLSEKFGLVEPQPRNYFKTIHRKGKNNESLYENHGTVYEEFEHELQRIQEGQVSLVDSDDDDEGSNEWDEVKTTTIEQQCTPQQAEEEDEMDKVDVKKHINEKAENLMENNRSFENNVDRNRQSNIVRKNNCGVDKVNKSVEMHQVDEILKNEYSKRNFTDKTMKKDYSNNDPRSSNHVERHREHKAHTEECEPRTGQIDSIELSETMDFGAHKNKHKNTKNDSKRNIQLNDVPRDKLNECETTESCENIGMILSTQNLRAFNEQASRVIRNRYDDTVAELCHFQKKNNKTGEHTSSTVQMTHQVHKSRSLSVQSNSDDQSDSMQTNDSNCQINSKNYRTQSSIFIEESETVLIFGGVDPHVSYEKYKKSGRQVYRYNPYKNTWEFICPMPIPRYHHSTVLFKGRVYLAGGVDPSSDKSNSVSNIMISLNPTNKNWMDEPSMLCPRKSFAFVVCLGKLYAIGGQDEDQLLGSVECYNPASSTWTFMTSLSVARMGMGVAQINNKIWIAGGFSGDQKNSILDIVESYDPATNQWTFVNRLRYPRCLTTLVNANNTLYLIGGASQTDVSNKRMYSVSDVDVWDEATKNWKLLTELVMPRHAHSACILGSQIVMVAGVTTVYNRVLKSVECWCFDRKTWIKGVTGLPNSISGHSSVSLPSR